MLATATKSLSSSAQITDSQTASCVTVETVAVHVIPSLEVNTERVPVANLGSNTNNLRLGDHAMAVHDPVPGSRPVHVGFIEGFAFVTYFEPLLNVAGP